MGFIFIYFISLSFYFFLLSLCTTEQCLAYHWWYAYHSLRNPALFDYHNTIRISWRVQIMKLLTVQFSPAPSLPFFLR
jgi:hypothetical protein